MAVGEYIASHTITYEYITTDDPHHGSPPFNFPMERREFTRVIFLSSLARVSKLLQIIPFRICFTLSNLYIHIVYTARRIYSRDLKILPRGKKGIYTHILA